MNSDELVSPKMKFSFFRNSLHELKTDLLAIPIFFDPSTKVAVVEDSFASIDSALDGLLSHLIEQEGFAGKTKDAILVHTRKVVEPARVLLLGLGDRNHFDLADTIRFGARVAHEANSRGCRSVGISLPSLDSTSFSQAAQFVAQGVSLGCYRFERYKSEKEPSVVENVAIAVDHNGLDPLAMARGELLARGICFARDLVNEPPSAMTPRHLADAARDLAKQVGLDCKILGPKECEKLGMRLLLAVAQGSAQEPRLIHLTYRPKAREVARSYALVGKGVTFDAGGLSIKAADGMEEMKCDMAGAAAILGAMSVLPTLGIKAEVHALIPAAENMPSSSAYRPGDVLVGFAGKSVEIINTDGEGRLLLADALAYASTELKANEIIDVATLTGACGIALGPYMAGVMGNDRSLVERFTAAARRAGEEMWQLPLPRNLKQQLDSDVADLKNVGKRQGGALTAGLFLQEFVGDTAWIHLDIAGPAFAEEKKDHISKGGTGYGVASLVEYLTSREGLS